MGLIGPFLPYLIGAVLVAGVLGGTYYKGREAGKEVIRAEFQPLLTACEGREKGLQGQIDAQNRAVEALAAESRAKQEKATRLLQDASRAAVGAIREADRLRGLAKAGNAATDCPAGQAVQAIREGLK